MKALGIDSATVACSAAISEDGNLLARQYETMTRGQSEAMMPMIEEVFDRAGLQAHDLDLIAVTVGPGAFTGLRIGIATAVGLSLASGINAVGISTTEAIAYGAQKENTGLGPVIVALDSKRDDIYLHAFSEFGQAIAPLQAIASININNWILKLNQPGPYTVIGDAAERAWEAMGSAGFSINPGASSGIPDAAHVAALAIEKSAAGVTMLGMKPLYLRPPDAVVPKNGGRLRA